MAKAESNDLSICGSCHKKKGIFLLWPESSQRIQNLSGRHSPLPGRIVLPYGEDAFGNREFQIGNVNLRQDRVYC